MVCLEVVFWNKASLWKIFRVELVAKALIIISSIVNELLALVINNHCGELLHAKCTCRLLPTENHKG